MLPSTFLSSDSGVGTTASSEEGMEWMNSTGSTKSPYRSWTFAEVCVCVWWCCLFVLFFKHFFKWGVFLPYPFNASLLRHKSSFLFRSSISWVKDVECMCPSPIFCGLGFVLFFSPLSLLSLHCISERESQVLPFSSSYGVRMVARLWLSSPQDCRWGAQRLWKGFPLYVFFLKSHCMSHGFCFP